MSFKDILVHLDNHGDARRLRLAIGLAQQAQGHLVGIYGLELPRDSMPSFVAAEGYAENHVSRTRYERERDAAFAQAEQTEAAFRAAAKRAGISADWRMIPDKPNDLIGLVVEQAHHADLVVLGQADPAHPLFDKLAALPETVMMACGRPVLIVPAAGEGDTVGKRVLIAWSGTREAARAVGDALPLLRAADAVTVLTIGPARGFEEGDDQAAANMVQHLARHDVRVDALYVPSGLGATGDLILAHAKDLGFDLLVMGGYGHSRTRELILGGVTRDILQHMTLPVLMSH